MGVGREQRLGQRLHQWCLKRYFKDSDNWANPWNVNHNKMKSLKQEDGTCSTPPSLSEWPYHSYALVPGVMWAVKSESSASLLCNSSLKHFYVPSWPWGDHFRSPTSKRSPFSFGCALADKGHQLWPCLLLFFIWAPHSTVRTKDRLQLFFWEIYVCGVCSPPYPHERETGPHGGC